MPKIMSEKKREICELDAESIAYYRRNPCIASADLLGINLIDAQKYLLQSSWNASHSLWCCSRDFGKSFLGAIFMILKALLFENQAIYIVSSVGSQSKETFTKIEEIVTRIGKTAASIDSLKDIVEKETIKSANNKTGFSHDPQGFHVSFYNGSEIITLNSAPDNNRSRRASLVFFDEAAFCSDELIVICEAFAAQDSDFITSTDKEFNINSKKRKCPTQLVYASSQDDTSKLFYKHYKNFSKRMFAGDRDYFVADMICDTAIETYMNGEKYKPLLTKSKVDTALKANREKAMREYYNQASMDGGINQIIKWGTIRRNEMFTLPIIENLDDSKYVLSLDPARTKDCSILTSMKLCYDKDIGYSGDIVNCRNYVDVASKRGYKLDSNRQLSEIRKSILAYNGYKDSKNPKTEYANIEKILIDQGAGGGGTSTYADGLLNNWVEDGIEHRGFIDSQHEIYEGYTNLYPDAVNKLSLINPKKYRTQMCDEFIELFNSGLIRLPYEYKDEVVTLVEKINEETEKVTKYSLSLEESESLMEIDIMKKEITSIYKFENAEKTSYTYALPKDKESKMNDDRFYTIIMLAHYLYWLRRGESINTSSNNEYIFDVS